MDDRQKVGPTFSFPFEVDALRSFFDLEALEESLCNNIRRPFRYTLRHPTFFRGGSAFSFLGESGSSTERSS